MGKLSSVVWRTALKRGLGGSSRPWTTVLLVIAATRLFKRFAGSKAETVYCEELRPGQSLLITHSADVRLG